MCGKRRYLNINLSCGNYVIELLYRKSSWFVISIARAVLVSLSIVCIVSISAAIIIQCYSATWLNVNNLLAPKTLSVTDV